jgi:hypothetical protein
VSWWEHATYAALSIDVLLLLGLAAWYSALALRDAWRLAMLARFALFAGVPWLRARRERRHRGEPVRVPLSDAEMSALVDMIRGGGNVMPIRARRGGPVASRPPWWRWYEPPRWWPKWLHVRTCTHCRGASAWVREQEARRG